MKQARTALLRATHRPPFLIPSPLAVSAAVDAGISPVTTSCYPAFAPIGGVIFRVTRPDDRYRYSEVSR